MSVASDLRRLADFYADHPDLPAPSVYLSADPTWLSDNGPAQIAAFVDGLDDLDIEERGEKHAQIHRRFGDVRVVLSAPVEFVTIVAPAPPPAPVFATADQLRQRAHRTTEAA